MEQDNIRLFGNFAKDNHEAVEKPLPPLFFAKTAVASVALGLLAGVVVVLKVSGIAALEDTVTEYFKFRMNAGFLSLAANSFAVSAVFCLLSGIFSMMFCGYIAINGLLFFKAAGSGAIAALLCFSCDWVQIGYIALSYIPGVVLSFTALAWICSGGAEFSYLAFKDNEPKSEVKEKKKVLAREYAVAFLLLVGSSAADSAFTSLANLFL
ncbi:MAG: hypothetical protein LBL82_04200 [Oscillospiraceae bacterium]|jgi:hypothetical protein|nr:hypothetical protein [Oscillospiraceae bacterium]